MGLIRCGELHLLVGMKRLLAARYAIKQFGIANHFLQESQLIGLRGVRGEEGE